MDPVILRLLVELILLPLLKELAGRRGVHGVTEANIRTFCEDPETVLASIKNNPALNRRVVEAIADAIDNLGSEAVDAISWVFGANTAGGPKDDNTGD